MYVCVCHTFIYVDRE